MEIGNFSFGQQYNGVQLFPVAYCAACGEKITPETLKQTLAAAAYNREKLPAPLGVVAVHAGQCYRLHEARVWQGAGRRVTIFAEPFRDYVLRLAFNLKLLTGKEVRSKGSAMLEAPML